MFELPIPIFDSGEPLHGDLARKARQAEKIAADVELPEGLHFARARRLIRDALREHGIAQEIDNLVDRLLG
jgi:hypothetical protein